MIESEITQNSNPNNQATEEMAWRISPIANKCVVEVQIWKKNGLLIQIGTTYRAGYIIVKQRPDLSGYSPHKGMNINDFKDESDCYAFVQGELEDICFSDEIPDEECKRLLDVLEEGDDELKGEDWELDTETYFIGPLLVEPVPSPWRGR